MLNLLFGKPKSDSISAIDTKNRLEEDKNIVLLDVRTPEEYAEIRIPNSVLVPLDKIKNKIEKQIADKNTEIIVYCHSGMRAATASKILQSMGYNNVKNLGGIMYWPYQTVSGK